MSSFIRLTKNKTLCTIKTIWINLLCTLEPEGWSDFKDSGTRSSSKPSEVSSFMIPVNIYVA